MSTDLVSVVRERAGAKAAAALIEYERLVEAAARGERGDPDEAVRVIEAAGKSANSFAADVSAFRRRGQLQALVDAIPALTAERRGSN